MGKNNQQPSKGTGAFNTTAQTTPTLVVTRHTRKQQLSAQSSEASRSQADVRRRSTSISSIDSFELLEKKLTTSLSKILNDRLDEMEARFTQRLDDILASFNSEVDKMRDCLDNLHRGLSELQDEIADLHRVQRLSDAVITGVLLTSNATPQRILEQIASTIGHSISPHSTAFRTTVRHGSTHSSNAPIIAKFSSSNEQRIFLQRFRAHGHVKLSAINCGFASDSKIGAYESLTHCNHKILREALKLRGQRLIHSVFTRHGLVFVRRLPGEPPLKVASTSELEHISLGESTSGVRTS